MINVYFFDKNLVRQGRLPVLGWTAVIRNNAVSTGVVDIDGNSDLWDGRYELEGGHVGIYDGKTQLIAGKLTRLERSQDGGLHDIQLQFSCHLSYVSGMITLPSPNRALTSQTVRPYYKEEGPAETIIADMVRLHVGQDAEDWNREPIIVEPSQGRGKNVKVNTRFKNLLEEIQELAGVGGIQFRSWLDYETGTIRFGFREPQDLSRSVRLREADGSITKYSYSLEAPTATRVLVAGQGEGTDRMLRLVETEQTDWEVKTLLFQDRRDTEETDELDQAGEETLADEGPKTAITIDTSTLGKRKYARDFLTGDTVTVQLTDKTNITDPLQRIELDSSADGLNYTVSVGPYLEEPDEDSTTETVRKLRRDLRGLEAN